MERIIVMELLKGFLIKDIIISEDFKQSPPRADKLQRMEDCHRRTGNLPVNIIVNDGNVLIDGYVTYIVAVSHGWNRMDIYRGCIEVVEAIHRPESAKSYRWFVPNRLRGTIQPGDRVLVSSTGGVKRVKVQKVIRQQYPENGLRLKNVYKKCCEDCLTRGKGWIIERL